MDAMIAFLEKNGLPAWAIAVLVLGYLAAEKLKLVVRPARKSDRELLSADEATFRKTLMDEVGVLRGEVRKLHAELSDCHDRHAVLADRLEELVDAAKEAGFDWLLKITHPAPHGGPVPGNKP